MAKVERKEIRKERDREMGKLTGANNNSQLGRG